jgi:hypothetical protein
VLSSSCLIAPSSLGSSISLPGSLLACISSHHSLLYPTLFFILFAHSMVLKGHSGRIHWGPLPHCLPSLPCRLQGLSAGDEEQKVREAPIIQHQSSTFCPLCWGLGIRRWPGSWESQQSWTINHYPQMETAHVSWGVGLCSVKKPSSRALPLTLQTYHLIFCPRGAGTRP